MKRELPIISIEGTDFLFDINKIALIEKQNPQNVMYIDHMRDFKTHYGFDYNTYTKNNNFLNLFNQSAARTPPVYIEIPRIGVLDPEGMCRKYGCTLKDIEQKTDFEIMVDQKVFNMRIRDIPVTIEFPGKRFEIDVENNVLHPQDGVGGNINLNWLREDHYLGDKEAYHIFYHIKEGKAVHRRFNDIKGMAGDLIILEIPCLGKLDPIGENMAWGANPRNGLLSRELKMNHVPQIIPLEQYGMSAIRDQKSNLSGNDPKKQSRDQKEPSQKENKLFKKVKGRKM